MEASLKISVAGKDVTSEVSDNLKHISETRTDTAVGADRGKEVLEMKDADSEEQLAGKHLELIRSSSYVDTSRFEFSGGAMGSMMRVVRRLLWKMLRPAFDWIVHKQNNINAQLIHALELEKNERDRQIAELKAEIKGTKAGDDGQAG